MGKSKAKSRSEIEFLRGKVRHLEAKLKQFKRDGVPMEDSEPNEDDEVVEVCKLCGKGLIKIIDLRYVIYRVCNQCDYREKIKSPE